MKLDEIAKNLELDVDDVKELLELYVETTTSELKELKIALDAKKIEEVHKRSHSIKGASGNLGIMEIYDIIKKIDDVACENKFDGLDAMVEELSIKFNQLVEEIES